MPWHRFIYTLSTALFLTNTQLSKKKVIQKIKEESILNSFIYRLFLWRLRCWGWLIIGYGRGEGRSQTPGTALVAGCDYTRTAYGKETRACPSAHPDSQPLFSDASCPLLEHYEYYGNCPGSSRTLGREYGHRKNWRITLGDVGVASPSKGKFFFFYLSRPRDLSLRFPSSIRRGNSGYPSAILDYPSFFKLFLRWPSSRRRRLEEEIKS